MSAALAILLLALPQAGPDVVVVCPTVFRQALEPWLDHRQRQGHHIDVWSGTSSSQQIRRRIRDVAEGGGLRFVVLVGDAEPGSKDNPAVGARCVPVHWEKAEVNVLWGSEPHIAADNWYADLDDDRVPDVAVGRLTADTPGELSRIVAKILAYERSRDFGRWRGRLNFVAGIGGFGRITDLVLESVTKQLLAQQIPPSYTLSMTQASWRSPYCPDPRLFHRTTLQRLNEGCLFWVYIGHGFHLGVDQVHVPQNQYHILANPDVAYLDCRHGAPIALFLACYTGAFDATEDCLAEHMLRTPGAPVAIAASSRVAMPYAMAVLATELTDQCFRRRCRTLGEAFMRAKQNMVKEPDDQDKDRAGLDALAAAISPTPSKLAAERAEHLLLFNLIGDPLLRLRHPQPIDVEVPPTVTAGEMLQVAGTTELTGRATIELVVRRDRLTFRMPSRREYSNRDEDLARFEEVYRKANDRRLASVDLAVEDGRFRTRLSVPEDSRGACHVRVFVEGADGFALGSADVRIQSKEKMSAAKGAGKPLSR